MKLKSEIIEKAYSRLRISGLTTEAVTEEVSLALDTLESMAYEWDSRNVCVGYNFTEAPDPNDESGIPPAFEYAFEANLASRLIPDFGKKEANDSVMKLQRLAAASYSNLSGRVANPRPTLYPSRQARGSGQTLRYWRWNRWYPGGTQSPPSCTTINMVDGQTNPYSQSFLFYLNDGETIQSYTEKTGNRLTVNSSALNSEGTGIDYNVTANKVGYEVLQFVITTSEGRVLPYDVNFNIETVTNGSVPYNQGRQG